jgi:hypothetical protein
VRFVQNSARGNQLTVGRSSRPLTLPAAKCESEFLIASDNPIRIVILPVLRKEGSDQRESKGLSFLIANLELEFQLSPIRITELRFSNRKYSQLFHSPWRIAKDSQATCSHRSNSNIQITEKELSRTKQRRKQNSNRNKIAFSANSVLRAFSLQRSAPTAQCQVASLSSPLSSAPNLAIIEFSTRGNL